MAKRRNKNIEEYNSPELTEKGLMEVNDESANTVNTAGFVQLLPEEDEPDMEVTITTASVNNDGSIEFTKETYIEPGRKAEKKESEFINELVNTISSAKSKVEPKDLRKADPNVVAKSKDNQAKKHISDNPFGKKVKPEIYKVKHNSNDERMTDTDLIDNIVML